MSAFSSFYCKIPMILLSLKTNFLGSNIGSSNCRLRRSPVYWYCRYHNLQSFSPVRIDSNLFKINFVQRGRPIELCHQPSSSFLCPLSSVFCHLPPTLFFAPAVFCHSLSVFRLRSSDICCLTPHNASRRPDVRSIFRATALRIIARFPQM